MAVTQQRIAKTRSAVDRVLQGSWSAIDGRDVAVSTHTGHKVEEMT